MPTPCSLAQATSNVSGAEGTVRVDATPGHVINSFDPDSALGSSIDVLSRRDIDSVYTPHIIQESLSAGWGPITYRNNTELRMAAWHWTENGAWSDSAHRSGYFTGSTELKEPTRYILAYALPHRGFATSGDRPVQGPEPFLLEKQSVSYQQIYRRERRAPSAMGGRRFERREGSKRSADRMGKSLRYEI